MKKTIKLIFSLLGIVAAVAGAIVGICYYLKKKGVFLSCSWRLFGKKRNSNSDDIILESDFSVGDEAGSDFDCTGEQFETSVTGEGMGQ